MKTLVIMRHAQAAEGSPDHQRLLSDHGKSQATHVGQRVTKIVGTIDQLFVSDAKRTQETLASLQEGGLHADDVLIEPGLYLCAGDDVLDILRAKGSGDIVMVVAHEPTMSAVALELWDGKGEARFESGFPTAAAAVFKFEGDWENLPLGAMELHHFVTAP
ncbi:phosphohistidine phosphatase [Trueperella bonasi]|uniref:Phosphohistidine phosphatase n=1 Tax=Trueperella bonasi TaxID=312286 RepID=A0ABT9NDT1_9ACTO|nr:histidine phosphatase family protein [Trueperella bonasi]MDP9805552.1 phosphohistidine phosphatase [Trueperella bonasi]